MPINSKILSKYRNDIFLETGSLIGDGIQASIDSGFDVAISIELSLDLHRRCQKRFERDLNVFLYFGDSKKWLPSILENKCFNFKTITYFLDSHYSGGTTAMGPEISPLLSELKIINKYYKKGDIILIDDVRCFPDFGVTLDVVKNNLLKINKDFNFILEDSYRKDEFMFEKDILVAK
jgi:hypothetical protein